MSTRGASACPPGLAGHRARVHSDGPRWARRRSVAACANRPGMSQRLQRWGDGGALLFGVILLYHVQTGLFPPHLTAAPLSL